MTGTSTSVPGFASAGGVTVVVPLSGFTSTSHPSGTSPGPSKCVPSGRSVSPVCGTSTGLPGFVVSSS
ncbi:hypothetical protein I6G39_09285 [Staphylococcus auricularis]|nr:hypothetical protein I6G39_09285 [Staphylococcus auricularis]